MLAPLSFRQAGLDDALCISGLATQVFLDTYANHGMRPDLAEEALNVYAPKEFRQRLAEPDRVLLLAEQNGHLQGFAEIRPSSEAPLAQLVQGYELVRLYVQRHAQRQGIGQALLEHAEHLTRDRGASCLWLSAWAENHSALAFYQTQGYAVVGNRTYEFGGNAYANQLLSKAC
ncbi:GNAT family N-acetyltransferase [Pseudomonas sp. NFXW11]|uniref:GNAT family N-acetyltransferase n=1 Tax=Pseudomonas sp. NFXW11 TaxID=2819531 RepID=UPI003CF1FF86